MFRPWTGHDGSCNLYDYFYFYGHSVSCLFAYVNTFRLKIFWSTCCRVTPRKELHLVYQMPYADFVDSTVQRIAALKGAKTMRRVYALAIIVLIASVCCLDQPGAQGKTTAGIGIGPNKAGELAPVDQPPWPDQIPGYTHLDPDTGLHMTGTPQHIELAEYRLAVTGAVDNPLLLSFDDIRRLPRLTAKPALICKGYFEDYANWTGASLAALLNLAVTSSSAKEVSLISADGYSTSLSMTEARSPDAFLAYELEGSILPVLHGFPLRAVFPALLGNKWAKWIVEIRVD
ncbi:MAG: hypothetical protein E4H20_07045 [Spirochaetales bacterium]|nr:MAG: hypothetical protein E4H20_07045 [Spirochaetales bacterium]